jgi:hypothetical protein
MYLYPCFYVYLNPSFYNQFPPMYLHVTPSFPKCTLGAYRHPQGRNDNIRRVQVLPPHAVHLRPALFPARPARHTRNLLLLRALRPRHRPGGGVRHQLLRARQPGEPLNLLFSPTIFLSLSSYPYLFILTHLSNLSTTKPDLFSL